MINDLKDLQKLFKLCRAQGITDFKFGGIEVKFGELPQAISALTGEVLSPEAINKFANFPQGELSPEQLMFYSSGGIPDEDPLNKEAI